MSIKYPGKPFSLTVVKSSVIIDIILLTLVYSATPKPHGSPAVSSSSSSRKQTEATLVVPRMLSLRSNPRKMGRSAKADTETTEQLGRILIPTFPAVTCRTGGLRNGTARLLLVMRAFRRSKGEERQEGRSVRRRLGKYRRRVERENGNKGEILHPGERIKVEA